MQRSTQRCCAAPQTQLARCEKSQAFRAWSSSVEKSSQLREQAWSLPLARNPERASTRTAAIAAARICPAGSPSPPLTPPHKGEGGPLSGNFGNAFGHDGASPFATAQSCGPSLLASHAGTRRAEWRSQVTRHAARERDLHQSLSCASNEVSAGPFIRRQRRGWTCHSAPAQGCHSSPRKPLGRALVRGIAVDADLPGTRPL